MATKRKLSEMLAPRRDSESVHIHVPSADPTDDIVSASDAFINTVSNLKNERDELRTRNEELYRKCIFLTKTNERLEQERDLCRRQSQEYIRANGELAATIGGMLAMAERASHTALMVQNISDAMTPQAPQPVAVYDQSGMPLDAPPTVTLEELESLSTVLSRTD